MAQKVLPCAAIADGVASIHRKWSTRSKSICIAPVRETTKSRSQRSTSVPQGSPTSVPALKNYQFRFLTTKIPDVVAGDGNSNNEYSTSSTQPIVPPINRGPVLPLATIPIDDEIPKAGPVEDALAPSSTSTVTDMNIPHEPDQSTEKSRSAKDSSPIEVIGSVELGSATAISTTKVDACDTTSTETGKAIYVPQTRDRESSPGVQITSVRKILQPSRRTFSQNNGKWNKPLPVINTLRSHAKYYPARSSFAAPNARDNPLVRGAHVPNVQSSSNLQHPIPGRSIYIPNISPIPFSSKQNPHHAYQSLYKDVDPRRFHEGVQEASVGGIQNRPIQKRAGSPFQRGELKRVKTESNHILPGQFIPWTASLANSTEESQLHNDSLSPRISPNFGSSIPALTADSDMYGKEKRWTARTWTSSQYAALAQACESSFPFANFEAVHKKARNEVLEVFAAVIQAPLLSRCGRSPGELRGGLGEERVKERRSREREMGYAQKKLRELQDRDRESEKIQLRREIELEVWNTVEREGWIRIEDARSVLIEKERERQKGVEEGCKVLDSAAANPARGTGRLQTTDSSVGRTRKVNRIKTVDEATTELQAASAELLKAKKAEERKLKRLEKNRRENDEIKEQKAEERKKRRLEKATKANGKGQL